ncbi:hypothetical protein [Kitasatospora sp. NPDC085464]
MSEQHPLASPDSWVVLRDPKELKAGAKKRILRSVQDSASNISMGLDVADGLMALLVENWQLPRPLPLPSVSPDSLDLMEIEDYDKLAELIRPAQQLLFPGNPDPTDAKDQAAQEADPASPTAPTVA